MYGHDDNSDKLCGPLALTYNNYAHPNYPELSFNYLGSDYVVNSTSHPPAFHVWQSQVENEH